MILPAFDLDVGKCIKLEITVSGFVEVLGLDSTTDEVEHCLDLMALSSFNRTGSDFVSVIWLMFVFSLSLTLT